MVDLQNIKQVCDFNVHKKMLHFTRAGLDPFKVERNSHENSPSRPVKKVRTCIMMPQRTNEAQSLKLPSVHETVLCLKDTANCHVAVCEAS